MRNKFDMQLDNLNNNLISMGARCEEAIACAVKSLLTGDSSLTAKAIEAYHEIERMERDIESLCMKLLLSQQPVASDLRQISSALKMITDMERIGDQAGDIAEICVYINPSDGRGGAHISDMAQSVIKMVTDSINAYVARSTDTARAVIAYDDVVDALFTNVKGDLIAMIAQDTSCGERALDILMIAKYLERIGDHAVNIAGWVLYSITGVHES